jgi:metal-responsive CopG/Arc/MetJ family transcriptional regulator
MRTIIDIPDEQLAPLTAFCNREAISRSEAVRQAIALFLDRHVGRADSAFGIWKGRGVEGVEYQRSLRREWGE